MFVSKEWQLRLGVNCIRSNSGICPKSVLPFIGFVQPLHRKDCDLRGVQSAFAPVAGGVAKEHVFVGECHCRVAVPAIWVVCQRLGSAPAFAVVARDSHAERGTFILQPGRDFAVVIPRD